MSAEKTLKSYDHVAGFYDVMSEVYSLGQISAAKTDQLRFLNADDRVLFVGCGGGIDVLAAARHGCQVTAVDSSRKMLDKVQARLDRESLPAELICELYQNVDSGPFDAVCPNFFLNCFPCETMEQHLQQVTSKVRPGGKLMIADVAPPSGGLLSRTTNRIYLHGAMVPFWMMGLVHWHKNHDYVASLNNIGWHVTDVTPFKMWKFGPVVFRNVVANRR